MALYLWIICGGGLAGAVRGCDRAPRFIRRSQSTAMMWWFAANMIKCAHIELGGLISIISQFSHPSQILVVSWLCFHVINRMEAIYLCSFGAPEAQKRIVLDQGTKTLMLKGAKMLCRVESDCSR